MRILCSLTVSVLLASCAAPPAPFDPSTLPDDVQVAELLSRRTHDDYEKATFSFEHGVRDDPDRSITRNDWDLQFGNGGDRFSVTMVTDDRSRLVDLGPLTWGEIDDAQLAIPEPHPDPEIDEPSRRVVVGHVYLVRTVDRETDLVALLRVESLIPDDRVTFSWRLVER